MNELALIANDYVLALVMSMIRLGVVFTVIPLFGQNILHGMVRITVIFSLTLIVVPHVLPSLPTPRPEMLALMPFVLKEAFIGLLIGFLAALIFWMAASIGFLIDNQRGASMASAFDPMAGGESSPLGILISRMIITTFFVTGGFMTLLSVVYTSYTIWPVFSMIPHINIAFSQCILSAFDVSIKMGAVYAAPIVLLLFFAEFGLGLMNRFAQQLNVFILSMPIKSGLAMFLFVLYFSFLQDYFKVEFLRVPYILKQLEALLS